MSTRALFENYVVKYLNDPVLAPLDVGSHTFNLTSAASAARVPITEIIEEVGPLSPALAKARRQDLHT